MPTPGFLFNKFFDLIYNNLVSGFCLFVSLGIERHKINDFMPNY